MTAAVASLAAISGSLESHSELVTGSTNMSRYVFQTQVLTRYQFPTHMTDLVVDRAQAGYSEVFVVVIQPHHASPLHKHDDMEQIFYVLAGNGTLTIGETKQELPVKPGDVVRVPVNTWHSLRAEGETDLRYLSVDCFGPMRAKTEPTWDDHIRTYCREHDLNFGKVVIPNGGGSSGK